MPELRIGVDTVLGVLAYPGRHPLALQFHHAVPAIFYEGLPHAGANWRAFLSGFIDRTDRVLALVEDFMPEAEWLDDGDTLTYLHSCISTRRQRVRVPEVPMHLDAIRPDEELTGGLEPRLGRANLRTLTVTGFPSQTWPGLLDDLNR